MHPLCKNFRIAPLADLRRQFTAPPPLNLKSSYAHGRDQSHKVRKIANEQGKGCEQSYNVNFITCCLITFSF